MQGWRIPRLCPDGSLGGFKRDGFTPDVFARDLEKEAAAAHQ